MRLAATILFSLCAALAWGADDAEAGAGPGGRKLDFQTGKVQVGSALATIDLPDGYKYLQQSDARFVVENVLHNPPNPSVVGLVVRSDGDQGFLAIVSYEDEQGHIKDDDAKTINYDQLLTQMQQQARDQAPARRKQGYPGYELLGWAEPPHYDGATHKLYWAQNAKFDDSAATTLNYNVRLLGARGVLVINAIGGSKDLSAIAAGSKTVLERTELSSGNRYEDFKPGIDKVAAYGIGGLIAGGLLLKTGFFAAVGKLILMLIKPLIVGVLLLFGAVAKLFGAKTAKTAGTAGSAGKQA
jgi:uncharacterized membrane-anchored protein